MDWRDASVPPAVVDAAAERGFGVLLTSARASGLSPAMRGIGVAALLLGLPYAVSVVAVVVGVPGAPLQALLGVLTVGGLIAVMLLRSRGRTLYLFEGGAVVVRDRQGVVEVVPWAEMVPIEVEQGVVSPGARRTFPALHVNGPRGRAFACTHDEAVRLADVISSVEVRRAWAALQAGEPVAYGPLTFTPDGLLVEGATLPWGEVTRFRTSGWWLVVRGAGRTGATELTRVMRATVPHQRTVIALGERLGALARRPHAG